MKPPLPFSIIITTYNRKHTLLKNIELLARQSYPLDQVELIVVVDGCTDGTGAALHRIGPHMPFPLRVLSLPPEEEKTFRFSQAHNLAIDQASKEYLFFLDDDALSMPTMLAQHQRFHYLALTKFKTDAAVIGATLEGADYTRLAQYKPEDIARADDFYRFCCNHGDNLPAHHFITNNASVKKAYVTGVGGFADTTEYWSGIDKDLGVRVKATFPHVRYMYAYTSVTAHRTIHPEDFKTARATSTFDLPDDVKTMMADKSARYRDILGIENAFDR